MDVCSNRLYVSLGRGSDRRGRESQRLANDHAALVRISRLFSADTADTIAWEVSSMNAVS